MKGMDVLGLCLDPTVAYLKSHPRAGVQKKDVAQVQTRADAGSYSDLTNVCQAQHSMAGHLWLELGHTTHVMK